MIDSFVSNATNFILYFILFFDNCLSVIKNDIHLFSPKLFTYPSIHGSFVPNGIIFLSHVNPIKYSKSLSLQQNFLDTTIVFNIYIIYIELIIRFVKCALFDTSISKSYTHFMKKILYEKKNTYEKKI